MPLSDSSLDRLQSPEFVRGLMIACVGVIGSLMVAIMIGVGEHFLLYFATCALIAILAIVGLNQRAWVLILLAWPLTGYSAILPVPLSGRDIGILLAILAYISHSMLSSEKTRQHWHPLDVALVVNLIWLAITVAVHPVGFRSLGAESIGARPILNAFYVGVAYYIILRQPRSIKLVTRIPVFILVGALVVSSLYAIAYFFPSVPSKLSFIYATLDVSAYYEQYGHDSDVPRYMALAKYGIPMIFLLCAYYPPVTLFNPFRPRFYLLVFCLLGILMSGFRSAFLWVFAAFAIGSWFYRGWEEVFRGAAVGGAILVLVLIGQGRLYELPLPAQRALSFLPGQWSEHVAEDAERSSTSRFEWWKSILKQKMIRNWWVGDGFGVSLDAYRSYLNSSQVYEWFTLTGGFHNGPLSTVRFVGVIGLILYYTLLLMGARYSVIAVNRCRGTPLFPVSIFLAIQALWTPIHYTFVFGAYDAGLPEQIFITAMLRLVIRMREELPDTPTKDASTVGELRQGTPRVPFGSWQPAYRASSTGDER